VETGQIKYIGVSNFSLAQLRNAQAAMRKYPIVSNRVLYNLNDRDIEQDLLPYCQQRQLRLMNTDDTKTHSELAKEWRVTPQEILARLEKIGISRKTVQSSLTEEEAEKIKIRLGLLPTPPSMVRKERLVSERVTASSGLSRRNEALA